MEIGIALDVFEPSSTPAEQAVERLACIGFQVLEFSFADWIFPGSPFVDKGWDTWLIGVRKRADARGVRFGLARGPVFNKFEDSDRTRLLTALCHRAVDGASLLGAPWISFELETRSGPWDAAHLTHVRQRNFDWFNALLPTASKGNVGLALTNSADILARGRGACRWYGSIPAELIDLADSFNNRLVGLCWNTGRAHLQRLDQAAVLHSIGARRLKAVQLSDNDGDRDQGLLPFQGSMDWQALFKALRAIDYQGDLSFTIGSALRPVPDALRDGALEYALSVGKEMRLWR